MFLAFLVGKCLLVALALAVLLFSARAQASLLFSASLRPRNWKGGVLRPSESVERRLGARTHFRPWRRLKDGEGGRVLQLSDGMGGRPGCAKAPSVHLGKGAPSLPPSPRPPIFHSRRCRSHPHREGRIWRRGAGRGHGVRRASGGLVSNRIGTSPALILLRHCCLVALNPFPPSFFRCLT